jgi:hypothetical protein
MSQLFHNRLGLPIVITVWAKGRPVCQNEALIPLCWSGGFNLWGRVDFHFSPRFLIAETGFYGDGKQVPG